MADSSAVPVTDSDFSLVEGELTCVPKDVAEARGPYVTALNLSENKISSGENLEHFTKLESLVLDKNEIETLWCNHNNVSDVQAFMAHCRDKFPALTMLSLMRNPASPPFMALSETDSVKQKRFRLFTIYSLPSLQFLDSAPVSPDERLEAKKKGQYLAVRKPSASTRGSRTASAASKGGDATSDAGGAAAGASAGAGAAAATATSAEEDSRKPAAFLGLGASAYDGRHSEGNRFIVDKDL